MDRLITFTIGSVVKNYFIRINDFLYTLEILGYGDDIYKILKVPWFHFKCRFKYPSKGSRIQSCRQGWGMDLIPNTHIYLTELNHQSI